MGTNAWLPKIHKIQPEVDLESWRSPAKSESWTSLSLHSLAVLPTHDNIVCIHMCDECKKANGPSICHKLRSIWWLLVQVCSLTIEYRVFQYVPSMSILGRSESILLTILPRISMLLVRNDGHQCMELVLCKVVESSCLPTHNIVPHISWHDLPDQRTMRRCLRQVSLNKIVFLLLLQKSWIQTYFCNCPQYLCLFLHSHSVQPKYTWSRNDVGSPKSTYFKGIFYIGSRCCLFPTIWTSSTYTDKKNPFSLSTEKHSQFGTFPNRVLIELSRIAFHIIVVPEDDRTDFAQ